MNKMFTRIIVFITLLMPVLAKAQPATSKPVAFYKYAFTSAWGGIPLPVVNINYGGPLSLYKPLLPGFSVTDAFDLAAIKPKAMSPTSLGGGEVEIFGNTNIAYPSTLEALNPFTKVRFLSAQIAIDKDGVLLLGGFARVTDEKIWGTNSIKRVSTKQRIVPLTNEITETDVFGDSEIIKATKEALSLDLSVPKSIIQKQEINNIPAIDSVKGIAYDPRSNHQDHFFYSTKNGSKRTIGVYFFSSNENIILNEQAVVGTKENVAGRMVVDRDGDIYIADAEQHVIVKFEMSDDAKEIQDFAIIGGRIGEPGYENDDDGEDARFNRPLGIAVDEDENVYISDAGNNCIRKIDGGLFGGDVSTFAGSEDGEDGSYNISFTEDPKVARFRNPLGIAYDYINQLLYVADNGNNVIRQLNLDGKVTAIDGNPLKGFGTNFNSPKDIAIDPSGFGFYVAAGKVVQYVNTYDGGYVLERQYRETPDQIFDNSPIVILPPGLTMKPNGAIFGIPVLAWEPTAYFAFAYNSAGKSLLPAVIILQVIPCPLVPDTVIVNDTIAFAQLPYTWNKKIFTEQGSKTISLKTRAGCDSIVVMNLSVLPKITYNSPNIYTNGIAIKPLVPINQGTTVVTYSIIPDLPPGLTLNTQSGVISGTPTEISLKSTELVNGPQILRTYNPIGTMSDLGADISFVQIAGLDGKVVLENRSGFLSLSGTLGVASGKAGSNADYSKLATINLNEGKGYQIELGSTVEGWNGGIYQDPIGQEFAKYSKTVRIFRNSFAIFIDLNRDGDFEDVGERVFRSVAPIEGAHVEIGSFILPKGISPGLTKMRIHCIENNVYTYFPLCTSGPKWCPPYYTDSLALSHYPQISQYYFLSDFGEFEDYAVNLIAFNGKDYIVKGVNSVGEDNTEVQIAVAGPSFSTTDLTICSNLLPYNWNGVQIDKAGTFIAHLKNVYGADSTATLNLSLLLASESTTYIEACGPYLWNGQTCAGNRDYYAKLINAVGCDSIAKLVFREKRTYSVTRVTVRPADLPFAWNGLSLTQSFTTVLNNFTNAAGCDSTANLVLKVAFNISYPAGDLIYPINQLINSIVPVIEGNYRPEGSAYTINYTQQLPPGLKLNANGTIYGTPTQLSPLQEYKIHLIDQYTPVAIVRLAVGIPTTSILNYNSCGPYSWNGNTYSIPGTYVKHLTNQYGMDSTATLNLTISKSSSSLTTKYVTKANLPLLWNGIQIDSSGTYTKIKTNAAGCDSITVLHLIVAPLISYPTPEIQAPAIAINPLIPIHTGGAVPPNIGEVKTLTNGVHPITIAVDKNNNVFFSTIDGILFKHAPNGLITTVATNIGVLGGLAIDNSGNIYTGRLIQNTIVKISPVGTQTIIASANEPSGLAIDAIGNVYFSEFSNHRIRKIGTDGIVKPLPVAVLLVMQTAQALLQGFIILRDWPLIRTEMFL